MLKISLSVFLIQSIKAAIRRIASERVEKFKRKLLQQRLHFFFPFLSSP
jgi:hypothetical protein